MLGAPTDEGTDVYGLITCDLCQATEAADDAATWGVHGVAILTICRLCNAALWARLDSRRLAEESLFEDQAERQATSADL